MIKKEEVFQNKSFWENLTDNEYENFVSKIFSYYRQIGFPYYPTDLNYRKKEFNKLKNYDRTGLINNDIIKQTMHGLALAWSYFPHAFNVKCGNKLTPYEAYLDDNIFVNVIRKRLKMGTYMSDSGIRKMLKIYSGVQGVSNFRPTAAALYDYYAPNGVVWDMSAGWGGRLLGAIISNVSKYIGTEPSELTVNGLNDIINDFGDNNYKIIKTGSEDYKLKKHSIDFCFTSPPYFNLEKYSNELTQSYIKFSNRDDWLNGFLKKTFENCYHGLKPKKYMAINIANVKGGELENDTIKVAQQIGFKLEKTLKLALSNINLRNKSNKFKYEPVFIFKK
jgi:hypothetical protein